MATVPSQGLPGLPVTGEPHPSELEEVFTELLEEHRAPLRVFIARRVRDEHLVEDTLQETFCRLWRELRGLWGRPRLHAWLYAVARNVVVDMRRRSSRESIRPPESEALREQGRRDGHCGASPQSLLESCEANRRFLAVLGSLPAHEKEVFLLRMESGMSFREIAARLDAPLNTVLGRMHRAMGRVRAALGHEPGGRLPPGGKGGGA